MGMEGPPRPEAPRDQEEEEQEEKAHEAAKFARSVSHMVAGVNELHGLDIKPTMVRISYRVMMKLCEVMNVEPEVRDRIAKEMGIEKPPPRRD